MAEGRRVQAQSTYVRELIHLAREYKESWTNVVKARSWGTDLLAGLTVSAVALPLNVGLAIASGMPPSAGIVAGILGGMIAALLGSAQLQVTGPSTALSVMVLAIAKDYGAVGVAVTALIVGIVELALAFSLAGRLVRKVPEAVLAGFTTGVGLKLLDQQFPELLGFPEIVDWASDRHADTIDIVTMMHRPMWLHDVSWLAAMCGVFVIFMVTATRSFRRFPAGLVSIALITAVSIYLKWDIQRVANIGEVPTKLPPMRFPLVADEKWIEIFVRALPLALLAGVESLLSGSATDRMANVKRPHDPNVELVGQGVANIVVSMFSGMPVSGGVARSGVNVQVGGRTRIAGISHAVFAGIMVMFLSAYISQVPLAALAGLLCIIGFRLIEFSTLHRLYKEDKVDALAFLCTAAGTVSGQLMIGLVAGLAIHFIGRRFLHAPHAEAAEAAAERRRSGIRAVLMKERAEARRPAHFEHLPSEYRKWLGQIREEPLVANSAYVHPAATVIGRVVVGERAHIAADTSVRADEGSPFHIGANTNIQDGVVLHALKDKRVLVAGEPWAIYVGRNVSIAHDALVHGPCYIGDETFVGFKAVVHDSVVGAHCYIGIGAVVVGVEVPDGRYVPHGRIVDSADAVDALPLVSEAHKEFNEDVVEVNRGLAVAYHQRERERSVQQREQELDAPRRAPVWDARWTTELPKEKF